MLKKGIIIILVCILTGMSGCGNKEEFSGLPDIVFVYDITYHDRYDDEAPKFTMGFYDKNGNYYTSTDEYVCTLRFEQLVQEYAEGKLSDKINLQTICNTEGLLENYNKLRKLNKDRFGIVYPETVYDVITNTESWYGLYYDKDGNLQSLLLHQRDVLGEYYASDKRANEIYEWYLGTFEE